MPRFKSIGVIPAPIPSFASHSHATWEIVLYTFGKGVATVGGEEIPFKPGTIICMPPHLPHQEKSEAGYTNIYMHTNEYPASVRVPVFQDTPERAFFQVAMLLHQEYRLRQSNWNLVTQDLFDILMLYLNRWRASRGAHPLAERLKSLIVQNLPDSEFDLGAAMAKLPSSSDHLRRIFREATGRTPLEYLIELRVDEAKHLLKIGGFRIKEVALRTGFSDPYYFSRLFRKVTGTSPTEFAEAG